MSGILTALLAAGSSSSMSILNLPDLAVDEDGWSGSINFNLSSATGNTENTVLGGRVLLGYKQSAISHALELGGNYTETTTTDDAGVDTSDVTQNNWFSQYRIEVETGDRTFIFGRTRYEEDQFSGFDRRVFIGAGIGHTVWKNERSDFQVLVGPGYQYFERERPVPLPDDFEESESQLAVFLGQSFNYVLRENVTFEQGLDTTITDANTTVNFRSALKTNLTERLSSRISYDVRHETDPPSGRKNTDTLLGVTLGYDF